MVIKKFLSLVTFLVLTFCLSSCGSSKSFRSELFSRDDEKIADMRFQEIIEVLEDGDKEGLKDMFSDKALEEADDIDGGIDYLMEFYEGEIISKDGARVGSGSNNYGKKKSQLECSYKVTTDVDNYNVLFVDKLVDTENSDNVGLFMLEITKAVEGETVRYWGGDKTKSAGIHYPNETEDK